jgi:hypothetical protein
MPTEIVTGDNFTDGELAALRRFKDNSEGLNLALRQ